MFLWLDDWDLLPGDGAEHGNASLGANVEGSKGYIWDEEEELTSRGLTIDSWKLSSLTWN